MIIQLRSLVADNGLHRRPGAGVDEQPSWHASAYGLGLLAAAGRAPELPAPTRLRRLADEAVAVEPLWNAWHIAMVETATGAEVPGDWAVGMLEEFQLPEEPIGQIGALAVAAEVIAWKEVPVCPFTGEGAGSGSGDRWGG